MVGTKKYAKRTGILNENSYYAQNGVNWSSGALDLFL